MVKIDLDCSIRKPRVTRSQIRTAHPENQWATQSDSHLPFLGLFFIPTGAPSNGAILWVENSKPIRATLMYSRDS
jgi:hypothetical protein